MEVKAIVQNMVRTHVRIPRIFSFSFLGAYMRNTSTYMASMPAPVPLSAETSMLFGDTNGSPYLYKS